MATVANENSDTAESAVDRETAFLYLQITKELMRGLTNMVPGPRGPGEDPVTAEEAAADEEAIAACRTSSLAFLEFIREHYYDGSAVFRPKISPICRKQIDELQPAERARLLSSGF